MAQPAVPTAKHDANQVLQPVQPVVQVLHQHGDGIRPLRIGFQVKQGISGGFKVQWLCILGDLRHRTELRQHGHLARQCRTKRIDSLYPKACRMVQQLPAAFSITLKCLAGQGPDVVLMLPLGRLIGTGRLQGLQDALAHLGSRLARESDGNDLFRGLHTRQEHEKPLHEQFGLPRTCRGLHNE